MNTDEDVIRHLYNADGTWNPDALEMYKEIARDAALCEICDAYATGVQDKVEDPAKFKTRPSVIQQAYAYGALVGRQQQDL